MASARYCSDCGKRLNDYEDKLCDICNESYNQDGEPDFDDIEESGE